MGNSATSIDQLIIKIRSKKQLSFLDGLTPLDRNRQMLTTGFVPRSDLLHPRKRIVT